MGKYNCFCNQWQKNNDRTYGHYMVLNKLTQAQLFFFQDLQAYLKI